MNDDRNTHPKLLLAGIVVVLLFAVGGIVFNARALADNSDPDMVGTLSPVIDLDASMLPPANDPSTPSTLDQPSSSGDDHHDDRRHGDDDDSKDHDDKKHDDDDSDDD
jgi:hypothetical protein